MVAVPPPRVLFHPDPLRLETSLAEHLRDLKTREPWARVLVTAPSQRMVERLRAAVPARLGSLVGVEILNYQGLAYRIVEEHRAPAPELMSRPVLEALLARVLHDLPGLELCAYAAARPGAVAELVTRLGELREAGMRPADLAAAAEDDQTRELAQVWGALETELGALLTHGWTDRAGLAQRAAQILRGEAAAISEPAEATGGALPRYHAVVAYGAYELVGVHLDLLHSLQPPYGITFLVLGDLASPAWSYGREIVRRHFGAPEPLPDCLESPSPFVAAARTLYDPEHPSTPLDPGRLEFTHVQGPEAELTLAARRVLALLGDGVPPSEIAIVARTLDPYLDLAETVLARHGLRVNSSGSIPLDRYPETRTLLLLLRTLSRDFDRRSVIELARSPHLRRPAWVTAASHLWRPHAWDRWSRAFGILGGLEEWTRHLPRLLRDRGVPHWIRDDPEETAAYLERRARESASAELLGRWVEGWADLRARWSSCRSAAEHAGILRSLPEEWIVGWGAGDEAQRNQESGQVALADLWEEIILQLEALERVMGMTSPESSPPRNLSLAQVSEFVVRSLLEGRVPRERGSGVAFLDVMQARGLPFRRVLLLGFNDRVFPRVPRENAILPDTLRAALRERTRRPLAVRSEGREEERQLLAQLVASTADHLSVSWQRADADGKALSVSLALGDLGRLLPGAPSMRDLLQGTSEFAPDRMPTEPVLGARYLATRTGLLLREEAALLAARGYGGTGGGPAQGLREFARNLDPALARDLEPSLALVETVEAEIPRSLAYDGSLPGDSGWRGPYSATTLEQLARCPLTFFFRHILRVKPLDEEVEEARVPAKDMGSAMHLLLERIYTDLSRQGFLIAGGEREGLVEAGLRSLDAAWDEVFAPVSQRVALRYPILHREMQVLWRGEIVAFLKKDLERLAEEDHRLESAERAWVEEIPLSVSPAETETIQPGRDHLLVQGVPDRVTQLPSGRRLLVDYKTSGKIEKLVHPLHALRGTHLQIPLYLFLGEARYGAGSVDAEVLGVGPAFLPEGGFARQDPPQLLSPALDRIRPGVLDTLAVLDGMPQTGRFPFHVADHCRWCGFKLACRRRHLQSRLRVEKHPEHRLYFALGKKTQNQLLAAPLAQHLEEAFDEDDEVEELDPDDRFHVGEDGP